MKVFLIVFYLLTVFTFSQSLDQIEDELTTDQLCSNGTEDSCEAFNSTEIPFTSVVEVTSEMTSTLASTMKPKITTAKAVLNKTQTLPVSNITTPPRPQSECTCDATRGGCEVNCCCDVDCSAEQRAVFTHCIAIPQAVDSDYCFPPQLLYRNNSDYQTVETESGVLCVVHQNTFATTDFVDVPVIKTMAAVAKKLGRHRFYSWPNPSPPSPVFDTASSYSSGSPVWISDSVTITQLGVPDSIGHSSLCLTKVRSLYLEDTQTSCTKPLTTGAECLAFAEPQFSVVSSPHSYNFTQHQDCSEDVCLPVQYYVCSDSCVKETVRRPVYNNTTHTCQNLIETVEYKIYYNGSQGIVDVEGFYTLRNVPVHRDQLIRKHYKVTFLWAGSTEQRVFRRSGHPGYDHGKPVLSGRRTAKGAIFNNSATDWISVSTAGSSGHCLSRYNLLFGENVWTQCLLNVKGTCDQIQQQIWHQLMGPAANLSEVVISSYGDPREQEPGAWVPLLSAELPLLPKLTTAVDIVIIYSLVGPLARPQAKIIAAYLNLLPSTKTCDSNETTMVVETSVKFIDKTTPAVTKFAQPPVYEIKLPQDFFYPFLSAGNRVYLSKGIFLLVIIYYNNYYYNYILL